MLLLLLLLLQKLHLKGSLKLLSPAMRLDPGGSAGTGSASKVAAAAAAAAQVLSHKLAACPAWCTSRSKARVSTKVQVSPSMPVSLQPA
jgi:hypothetical protein